MLSPWRLHLDARARGLGAQGPLLLVHVVAEGAARQRAHGGADEAARGAVTTAGNLTANQRARRGADNRSAGGLGALLVGLAAGEGDGADEEGRDQHDLVHRRAPCFLEWVWVGKGDGRVPNRTPRAQRRAGRRDAELI